MNFSLNFLLAVTVLTFFKELYYGVDWISSAIFMYMISSNRCYIDICQLKKKKCDKYGHFYLVAN